MLRRIAVVGSSMQPTLCSGDRVYIATLGRQWWLRVGAIVVVQPPHSSMIIKRVQKIEPRTLQLCSDNSDVESNYHTRPIPLEWVVGRVVWVSRGAKAQSHQR